MGVTQTLYSYGDSMSIEAMKQALEAFRTFEEADVINARNALRQAIEQAELAKPEHANPAAKHWHDLYKSKCQEFHDKQTILGTEIVALQEELAELKEEQLDKPEQEPVAWMLDFIDDGFEVKDFVVTKPEYIGAGYNVRPLYTAPSSKEWVGLDDEDWMNVPDFQKEGCELDAAIYDWIEARLKEKNT